MSEKNNGAGLESLKFKYAAQTWIIFCDYESVHRSGSSAISGVKKVDFQKVTLFSLCGYSGLLFNTRPISCYSVTFASFLLKQILRVFPTTHSWCLSSDLFLPCLTELCPVPCGSHGACSEGQCQCEEGWTGAACDQRACHPRCEEHGQCHDGTCICQPGWEGEHCNIGELCVCVCVCYQDYHRYIDEYWKRNKKYVAVCPLFSSRIGTHSHSWFGRGC